MTEFFILIRGIYAIVWRELIVFTREKPRLISALISPIIWFIVFSSGFGPAIGNINGIAYKEYLFIGIITQTILFTSIFYGAYLVWDRKIDALKAILVSPMDRTIIFYGKVFGGTIIGLIEVLMLIILGLFLGININLISVIKLIPIVILTNIIFTAIGLSIGSVMSSPEGFQLLSTFVIFPLFFLSGAIFPISNLSGTLELLAKLNPLTYIVDLMRYSVFKIAIFNI
ncbi:MAG: ABC transporter permease, partial [Candidatus Anstonellales archaeon]